MCDYGSKRANAGSETVRFMEMDPGLSFRHFQTDLPIHIPGGWDQYIKGWVQRRTERMVFLWCTCQEQINPRFGGHNSQFHWISARVKGNTCLSRPMYLYYSHISVPNNYIVLFFCQRRGASPQRPLQA